jgi:hypothetical protein
MRCRTQSDAAPATMTEWSPCTDDGQTGQDEGHVDDGIDERRDPQHGRGAKQLYKSGVADHKNGRLGRAPHGIRQVPADREGERAMNLYALAVKHRTRDYWTLDQRLFATREAAEAWGAAEVVNDCETLSRRI